MLAECFNFLKSDVDFIEGHKSVITFGWMCVHLSGLYHRSNCVQLMDN